jgi:hypothetical protein
MGRSLVSEADNHATYMAAILAMRIVHGDGGVCGALEMSPRSRHTLTITSEV